MESSLHFSRSNPDVHTDPIFRTAPFVTQWECSEFRW
jgi:hypothetical protein